MSLRRREFVLGSVVRRSMFAPAGQGGDNGPAPSGSSSLLTYLQAYYAFETLTFDSSGNGNTLTNNNGVTQAAGLIGQAASFASASSQYLSRAETTTTAIAGVDWIWAGWVNFATVTGTVDLFSKSSGATAATIEFTIRKVVTTNLIRLLVSNGSAFTTLTDAGSDQTAGIWCFVQAGYHAATSTIYLKTNNRTTVTATQTGQIPSTGSPTLMGASNSAVPTDFLNGQLDEWGLWKPPDVSAVFESYAAALFNGGVGVTYPFTGVP